MPRHELDALGHQVVGNRHRQPWITGIVGNLKHKLLAIDPAAGIDVRHGAAHALAQLLAKGRVLALQGPRRCNEDLGTGRNAHGA